MIVIFLFPIGILLKTISCERESEGKRAGERETEREGERETEREQNGERESE